jgi:hypothetical protein
MRFVSEDYPSRVELRPGISSAGDIVALIMAAMFTMPIGALMGMALAVHLGWANWVVLIAAICGAVSCGAFAAAMIAGILITLRRFAIYANQLSVTPPPPGVLCTGAFLGAAEGAIIGAFHGGLVAGIGGGILGTVFGSGVALCTWIVRTNVRLYVVALVIAALVELLGGIGIGILAQHMARDRFAMIMAASWLAMSALNWALRPRIKRKQGELESRRHVDDSIDQLSKLHLRHRFPAAQEFIAGQPLTGA